MVYQNIIALLVIAGAVLYAARWIYRNITGKGKCGHCRGSCPDERIQPPQ